MKNIMKRQPGANTGSAGGDQIVHAGANTGSSGSSEQVRPVA